MYWQKSPPCWTTAKGWSKRAQSKWWCIFICGLVSQGLATTEFKHLIGWNPNWKRFVVTVVFKKVTKNMKSLFLFIIEESVDLHEEAGKQNERTLADLSPAEEATRKDVQKSKLRNFGRSRNKKTLNTRLRAIWTRGRNCESLKESRAIEYTCQRARPSFV